MHGTTRPDSSAFSGFGYGKFPVNKTTVTETRIFPNYQEVIDAPITVVYKLNDNNLLSLNFDDGNSKTTETYKRLN